MNKHNVTRTAEHVQQARDILKLEYQDQLAIIGELLAAKERHADELRDAYIDGLYEDKPKY